MSQLTDFDEELRRKRDNLRWPLRAKVVLENYRLKAQDLRGEWAGRQGYFRVQILNVSLEGLEELSVLLHLEGLAKPLRLTHQQRQEMALMFQSQNFADWIGQSLALTLSKSSSQSTEVNHIELTLLEESRDLSVHPPSTVHNEIPTTEESGLTAATKEPPVRNEIEKKRPYAHFSGVGQDYAVADPSAASFSGQERFRRPMLPSWLRNVGDSAGYKQVQMLLGPNFVIALVLFLLIVAVVNFEQIADFVAFLLP